MYPKRKASFRMQRETASKPVMPLHTASGIPESFAEVDLKPDLTSIAWGANVA